MSLRLLSYNIRFGGVDRDRLIAGVIAAARPDLVLLQEATRPEIVERIAHGCGMPVWGARQGHSVAFLSRVPVAQHEWRQTPLARRHYLELVLAGSGLRIYGVHLSAIHSNPTERRRTYELQSLLRAIGGAASGFHIVAGDFNTLAPGEELDVGKLPIRLRAFIWMTGRRLRWSTIRVMLDAGYADVYRTLHKDSGYTFPAWDPHVRLDYFFLPANAAARATRCEIFGGAPSVRAASDHLPLLAEIAVETPAV